ncbi:MAG TPA: ABC transporter permease [Alphaproteobacteria bacterium]|nr:ABC transporter permease [Rhodospirillaceae bacterium]HRJ13109.1 ABC transporter permease [Alphaproteobacteria bacterium]
MTTAAKPADLILDFCQGIGAVIVQFCQATGKFAWFTLLSISHIFRPPYYWRNLVKQLIEVGYYSLPVVGLTAIFTGMVLVLQSYTGFARFNAESAIASVVVLSITRELGPVLGGLMVAGRIGAAFAAELGTMRVTEQIDALRTLSTSPFKYLVAPRLIAGVVMLPILVLVADIIGVLGGYLVAVYRLDFNPYTYLQHTWNFLENMDVVSGLVKASVFGFIITLMGCYHGYHSGKGAEGVGAATTHAVVSASILILLSNYFLTGLFFGS